jgi:outer membrane protein assembly factor BamE
MPVISPCRSGALAAVLLAGLSLAACSSVSDSTRGALTAVTPYKAEVVQGNFVSKEQVAALQPGMTRQQVREILGTSLLADVFHGNRWDYVFTIRRQGIEPQQRHLTVYFNGEVLDHFEGDAMPSEEEFVAELDTRRKSGKVPELEASPERLEKVAPPVQAKPDEEAVQRPPLPASYPPLESTAR